MEHKKKRGRPKKVAEETAVDLVKKYGTKFVPVEQVEKSIRDLANDFSELIDRLLVTQEAHRLPWQPHGLVPANYIHLGIDRIMAEHGYTPTNNIEQL